MEGLEDIIITPVRASKKSENLTLKELSVLKGLVGRMNLAVKGTIPDLAFEMVELGTKFRRGVADDLLNATNRVKRLKQGESKIMFPNLCETAEWKLIVFTDAAHANLCDGISSMGAHLLLLTGVKQKMLSSILGS